MHPRSEKRLFTAARKRRQWRRRRLLARRFAYLVSGVILGTSCLYWLLTSKKLLPDLPPSVPVANREGDLPVRSAAIRKPSRAVYPHSVIRGGAYSRAELNAALYADPVAAAHYEVFDRTQVRVVPAPESADVYVSYRQGNRVYWTRRKVHLAAEEALLTDGVHSARARCGNRISVTPQEPSQAVEPLPAELDIPELPAVVTAGAPEDGPPDVYALPLVVHEVFPGLFGNPVPGMVPGGGGGAGQGTSGQGGLGGMQFGGLPMGPPFEVLPPPESIVPPPAPGTAPIVFAQLPPPVEGPGFLWFPPVPPIGGYGPGPVPLPGGTFSPPTFTWVLPPGSFPSVPAGPVIPVVPGGPGERGGHGHSPTTVPGSPTTFQPTDSGSPPPDIPLPPPGGPTPFDTEIPEPAAAILLLSGAAAIAFLKRAAPSAPRR